MSRSRDFPSWLKVGNLILPTPECSLLRPSADWKVSRFLRHFRAKSCSFQRKTVIVTGPTRGAFSAGSRTRSHCVAGRSLGRFGNRVTLAPSVSCLSLAREPHAGGHDCETIEQVAKKAAEISAIERQNNIGRRQGTEENGAVLLYGKYGGLVDCHDIVDDELAPAISSAGSSASASPAPGAQHAARYSSWPSPARAAASARPATAGTWHRRRRISPITSSRRCPCGSG